MADHRSKKRNLATLGVVGVVVLGLMVCAYLLGLSQASAPAVASAPITSSAGAAPAPSPPLAAPSTTTGVLPTGDTDVAPAPGMNPDFAPPDGPDPDDPMYGVDVVALAGEFRTHGVDTPPELYPDLLAATNYHYSRGLDDMVAWDEPMKHDVQRIYPHLKRGLTIDTTRCWAEYVERLRARNAGKAAPPDSDDHNVRVDNRAPQPRITQSPIVTPTS